MDRSKLRGLSNGKKKEKKRGGHKKAPARKHIPKHTNTYTYTHTNTNTYASNNTNTKTQTYTPLIYENLPHNAPYLQLNVYSTPQCGL